MYRILIAKETEPLADGFRRLLADGVSAATTAHALDEMEVLMASGPQATIPVMAGRAEAGLGDPETVALSTALLTRDLLTALKRS
ncbi:hypothetical protein [Paractinoplanes durhamensis]